jgi:hypothetical protein
MKAVSHIRRLCGGPGPAPGRRPALAGTTAGRLRLFLVPAMVLLIIAPASASRPGSAFSGLKSYLVQMHVHGHSNHNGNDLPASMESQCYEASRNGFDVVWWTDHEFLFEGFQDDIVIDFKDARFSPDSTFLVFADSPARSLSRIDVGRPSGVTHIGVTDGRLGIRVESEPASGRPGRRELALASERGKVKLVNFCRPVTSGLQFKSWGKIRGLGRDTSVRLEFDFSWHPEGRHRAVFDLVPNGGGDRRVIGDTTVVQQVEVSGQSLDLVLDLEAALAPLPNGDDNTLSSCRVEIAARNGGAVEVMLDSLKIVSTKPDGENQYNTVKRLVHRYGDTYGLTQYVGVEVGLLHLPTMPHMNAFLPASEATYGNTSVAGDLSRSEWIAYIHDHGGLVCVDHPFGAALRPARLDGQELPSDVSLRELSQRKGVVDEGYFRDVAKPIVEGGAWHADLLEVGYLFRGAGSLRDHLRLWDLALANGVRLMGFGSSDSHGGIWGPNMEPNPFATWIWSTSDGADDLLDAMRSGRMVFGDPFLWKSELFFGVGDALMGDTLFVESGEEVGGWIHMEPWRRDLEVRLVQVEIRSSDEVRRIRSDVVEDTRGEFAIKTKKPCFARIEVYTEDGIPLAFTNPVYLIPR